MIAGCDGCDDVVTVSGAGMLQYHFLPREQSHKYSRLVSSQTNWKVGSDNIKGSWERWLSGPGTVVTMLLPLYHSTTVYPPLRNSKFINSESVVTILGLVGNQINPDSKFHLERIVIRK